MTNFDLNLFNWNQINTILLDMDGTLLDLHYDDYFWQEYLPTEYARLNNLSIKDAQQRLVPKFKSMEGTLEWYCLDYWSRELQIKIPELKARIAHLISVHDGVVDFLHAARENQKTIMLVTNAHPDAVSLKMHHTQLENQFDQIISSHQFGLPKENPEFWHRLIDKHFFAPEHTLFIDDSYPVLRSAQKFGIRYLLSIEKPSSTKPGRTHDEFIMLSSFRDLIPHLHPS